VGAVKTTLVYALLLSNVCSSAASDFTCCKLFCGGFGRRCRAASLNQSELRRRHGMQVINIISRTVSIHTGGTAGLGPFQQEYPQTSSLPNGAWV
jgi:hypothetical protein